MDDERHSGAGAAEPPEAEGRTGPHEEPGRQRPRIRRPWLPPATFEPPATGPARPPRRASSSGPRGSAGARLHLAGGGFSLVNGRKGDPSSDPIRAMLAARSLKPVGWPLRLAAFVIDAALFVPVYILALLTMGDLLESSPAVLGLVLVGVPFVYWTVAEGLTGRTVGKAVLGMWVMGQDGSALTWRAALVRNLLKYSTFVVPFAEFITLLAIIASPNEQRIGDLVARTVVVRRDHDAGPDGDPRGDPLELHQQGAL